MTDNGNTTGDFLRNLGDAARQNPASAALIGMGVLWLFTSGSRRAAPGAFSAVGNAVAAGGAAVRSGLDSVGTGASQLADTLGRSAQRAGAAAGDALGAATGAVSETSADAYGRVAHMGSDLADTATDMARAIPGSASDAFDNARANLASMFEQQPLLLGAVGIAIGAGIAASFPSTQVETDYLGDTSDQVKDKAQEILSEQSGRARVIAESAVKAATEEAHRQGLDPEGLKSAATDIGARVKAVVGTVTSGADRMR